MGLLLVSLVDFEGDLCVGKVYFCWCILNEMNNECFIIECSVDGCIFIVIGEVVGFGNS